MKRNSLIAGILISLLVFTGCSSTNVPSEKVEEKSLEVVKENANDKTESKSESMSLSGIGEMPTVVTSFGQSADVAMLKALFSKAGIEITYDTVIKAEALTGTKTLFIAAGASTKGLGAAGIKPEEELERAKAIVQQAKDAGIKIVAVHLGGSARRGELSDEFIKLALEEASAIIVVADGDEDGLFTKYGEQNSIPVVLVESIAKAVEPIQNMFE